MLMRVRDIHKRGWESKTDEEKELHRQKAIDVYNRLSPEEKELHRKKSIAYWENLSEADYLKYSQECRALWDGRSEEFKNVHINKLVNGTIKRWKNANAEDKLKQMELLRDGFLKWYHSLSEEDRESHHREIGKHIKILWDNASEEWKENHKKKSIAYWENLSDTEKEKYRQSKVKEWYSRTPEEYQKWNTSRSTKLKEYKRNLHIRPNKTEKIFVEKLRSLGIPYEFHYRNQHKHSEFNNIFPLNPVTGSPYVNCIHEWDFLVHLPNKKYILIDIDGSIHKNKSFDIISNFSGKSYNMLDYIHFNDSKREYQTDGLDAYIIKCYTDKLEDMTLVENIKTKESIPFVCFLNIIQCKGDFNMNLPIEIYTDGSALNNPNGPSGFAYIIRYWNSDNDNDMPTATDFEFKQGFRSSTNNRMEMMAAIFGIKDVLKRIKDGSFTTKNVTVISDSRYVCDAINKRWIDKWPQKGWVTSTNFPVKNKDLWETIIEILDTCKKEGVILTFSHVFGHNGNEYNEKADQLAVSASNDSANHSIDEVYETTIKGKKNYYQKE